MLKRRYGDRWYKYIQFEDEEGFEDDEDFEFDEDFDDDTPF